MLFNLGCMYPKAAESEVLPLILMSPPTARLERYPVPPVMLPLPSTEKGKVVPLKTLKPPPLVARKPELWAVTPVAIADVAFNWPVAIVEEARSPKLPVPEHVMSEVVVICPVTARVPV